VEIEKFKYYKFTIPEQDLQTIKNVTIEINPLHGDSDLLVSTSTLFPDKTNYEKRSSRIGSMVDYVTYSLDNQTNSLAATYYIGVYGYTYSTYSIVVSIIRS